MTEGPDFFSHHMTLYHIVVNLVFSGCSETKSETESSSSETRDLKYGEDPGPYPDDSLRCFVNDSIHDKTN